MAERCAERDPLPAWRVVSGLATDPEDQAVDSLRRLEVRRALSHLPERDRRVLELRFGLDGDPQPLETIGKELGISRERVRQVEGEAMAQLAELLGDLRDDDELEQAA